MNFWKKEVLFLSKNEAIFPYVNFTVFFFVVVVVICFFVFSYPSMGR